MVTEIKEKEWYDWFKRHWIISIFLGLIVLGMLSSIFDSGNNSEITGNVVNEQGGQLQMNLYTTDGGLEEFPFKVKESIENSNVFDYWKLTNKEKADFIYYSSENYGAFLNTLELESLKESAEEKCGNKFIPQEMILGSEEGVILWIGADGGKIICDVVLTEPLQKKVETCTPNWNCNSWSECSSSGIQKRTCTDANNCNVLTNKPQESQSCEYKKTSTEESSSDGWASDLKDSLEEMQKGLDIYKKKQLCAELCAGEYADIPAVKNECLLDCSQTYYYGGEEALDKYISELQG